ncbi:hypothetical protein Tco_0730401 [Tanacetum coccineum]|uniref:Retroviral polymerase SH3-like domain-containing protein n=1 Tax=Tanacetum coccineum TaxID=301880 RepID=A0ABQ4YS28_9ASTR
MSEFLILGKVHFEIQYLGDKHVKLDVKKQNSTRKVYSGGRLRALTTRCAQLMWMRIQLKIWLQLQQNPLFLSKDWNEMFRLQLIWKNDREDIGKLGAKGDIGFFIGYSTTSYAYRVYNRRIKKVIETMNVTFDELSAMDSEQCSSKPELQGMTSGHISGQPSDATRTALTAPVTQNLQTPNASTTTTKYAPTLTNSSSQAPTIPITSQDVDERQHNNNIFSNKMINQNSNLKQLLIISIMQLTMEYLMKISKKARILELKRRHLKITVLTSYTLYRSRKIRRICACTSLKNTKEQGSIRRIQRSLYVFILVYVLLYATYHSTGSSDTDQIASLVGPAGDPWDQRVRSQLIGKDLVMAAPTIPVSADSFEGSFGDMIDIAQHGEAIQGIQEHLLEVPIQEKLRDMRDRVDIAEAESVSLRATIRMMRAVEMVLRNRVRDERQTRIEIERQLTSV